MRGKKLVERKKRNKRIKRMCWTIFFLVLLLLLLTFTFMYITSKGPDQGDKFVTRTTPNIVLFSGNHAPVELVVNPSALTANLPPPEGRKLDILIGLDNSLSLQIPPNPEKPEESAFDHIKKISQKFLENTDLKKHKLGIARLDNQARVIQGFSQNLPVLQRVINELPRGGSTSLHEGMEAMEREFNSMRRRPGSIRVAILLTDGRTNNKHALEAAERLKQLDNTYVATIGFGENTNDELLKNICSWPSEYKKSVDINKLTAIYSNWLHNLEQLVAVDVRVREYYNNTGLALVRNKIDPTGHIEEKYIEWKLPFLVTEQKKFKYTQAVPAIGWYQLDPTTSTVSLKPVGNMEIEIPIHRKPKIIVLSPLLLLLLLILLLLILLPLLLNWFKLKLASRGPARIPEKLPQPTPPPTPKLLPSLDLKKLIRSTAPTIVIGLGGTGRWVLTYLKKAVMETNYGRLPNSIKFLLIDVCEKEVSGEGSRNIQIGGVELEENECLILNEGGTKPENLLERTRNMKESSDSELHLKNWWLAKTFKDLTPEAFQISSGTKQRRPFGRLSLFLDLEGGPETSRFWTYLSKLLGDLDEQGEEKKENTNVFITSSLSGGTGSGMLIDVAYLVRQIVNTEGLRGIMVHAALALQNTFSKFTDSLELTNPNTFAALRELDRFLSCRDFKFPMIYSPHEADKVNGFLEAPLLDNCYVFDAERAPVSLSKELPEHGVFPSMSDTIHTYLYNTAGSSFDKEVRQRKAVSEMEREETGHGIVSSLGTFVFRLPVYEYIQIFKFRFSKKLIAEIFNLFKNEKGEWIPKPLNAKEKEILNTELEVFLNKDGPELSPTDVLQTLAMNDAEMLLAVVEADRAIKSENIYIEQHKVNFSRYLAGYVMNILNFQSDGSSFDQKKFLATTLHFTRGLTARIDELFKQKLEVGRNAKVVEGILSAYGDVTSEVVKQLTTYEEHILPSLLKDLEIEEKKQTADRKTQNLIKVRKYLHDDEMEIKLYRDYLGEKVLREHLTRFVWDFREKETKCVPALKLVTDKITVIDPSATTTEHVNLVTNLPEILLQSLWDLDITPYLETAYPDADKLAKQLYETSMPLIQYEKHLAARHTMKMFLSIHQSDYLHELIQSLRPNFPRREHILGTEFRDVHVFSSVSVLDSLPLPALMPYEKARQAYLSLAPSHRRQLHIFAAEQRATVYEESLPEIKEPKYTFHPRFISHLEHPERTKLFAVCAFSGLIPDLFGYHADQYFLEIPDKSEKHRFLLAQSEAGHNPTPMDALNSFISGKCITEDGQTIPFDKCEKFLESHPANKKDLDKKEKEINFMKADKEISLDVKSLLSFIHLILNAARKKLEK